jgi:mxaK protein
MNADATAGWVTRKAHQVSATFAQCRQYVFGVIALLGLVGLVGSAHELWSRSKQNAMLRAIVAGSDVAVDPGSWDGLVVARARSLDRRDRFDEAQAFIDEALPRLAPISQAAVLYNHANVLVERAIARIERGDLDGAIPLINLAKDGYKRALRLEPENFDIKYNFDVAMRLVRDFPPGGKEGEDETATPKKLWTDLPGIPKGLP